MQRILIVQTAFLGDVILSTSLIETLKKYIPEARIDFLLRKGNEACLSNYPHINKIWIWNKKKNKLHNLFKTIRSIRKERYDVLINVQRFFSTGLITAFSGAKTTIGFSKNPLSFLFSHQIKHDWSKHEIDRNAALLHPILSTIFEIKKPRLYPNKEDKALVRQHDTAKPYVCMAPASVWYTKQMHIEKWIELCQKIKQDYPIFFIGGKEDNALAEKIIESAGLKSAANLCGKLSILASGALMKTAKMNYVNDSAPAHIATAVNAPVCQIFCSTVPEFGFSVRSGQAHIVETKEKLPCRPCGNHGKKTCPEKHFKCGKKIDIDELTMALMDM